MNEIISTTATDLIPYPGKPAIHEKMTFEAIIYCLDWNDNNPDPQACLTSEELGLLTEQLPTKVDGYAQWLDKLADEEKRARDYAQKFSELARQRKAQIERHLRHIKRVMEKHGFEKMPGDAFQFSIRKSSSVATTRPPTADDSLSDFGPFVRTTITHKWDLVALMNSLKAGQTFDFANIEYEKNVNFSIKKG